MQRLAISAFLAFHLAMTALWNLPFCPLRNRLEPIAAYYLFPLGLWQNWAMFAPDPVRHTYLFDAIAIDKNGILYTFPFPKMTDFPTIWDKALRVRHSKFASYFGNDEFKIQREIAARYVVRQLNIPREAFPVEVELQYQVRETPPAGTVPDPMAPTVTHPIKAYRFLTWEEARP